MFSTDHEQKRTENVVTYKLNGTFDKQALEILIDYAYTSKLKVLYQQVCSQLGLQFYSYMVLGLPVKWL